MFVPLLLAGLVVLQASDELEQRLQELASPRSQERDAAERWLGAHLESGRYPELAEAALAGDQEVRSRLIRALTRDERHLGLALALLHDPNPTLSVLGEEAVHGCVTQFDPRLGELGAHGEALKRALRERAKDDPPRLVRIDPRLSLERILEGLEFFGQVPIGLTVDPSMAARSLRRDEAPIIGPWDEALQRLAQTLGVSLEGYGLSGDPELEGARRGFLRFTSEPSSLRRTGADLLIEWLRTVGSSLPARESSSAAIGEARACAARDLAASGFVPAQAWMEGLYRESVDPAAVEGLLWAAALGRVSPSLAEPATFVRILDESLDDAAAPEGSLRLARVLGSLSRVGCTGPRGEELVPALLYGFEQCTPRARWARLLLCERFGCAEVEVETRARATLADPAAPPALRRQALWTWGALARGRRSEVPAVGGLLELFREPLTSAEAQRLGRHLELFGIEPPVRDPAVLSAGFAQDSRLALIGAWLWHGEDGPAAAHLAALLQRDESEAPADRRLPVARAALGETLADEFEPWVRRGAGQRIRDLLQAAKGLAPKHSSELERLALLLGVVPARELEALLGHFAAVLSGPGADLVLVGALAGRPEALPAAEAARATLLEALGEALRADQKPEASSALLSGLERAWGGLYAAGRDQDAEAFSQQVRRALRSNPRADLSRRFEHEPWPIPPGIEVRDIGAAFQPYEVPAPL